MGRRREDQQQQETSRKALDELALAIALQAGASEAAAVAAITAALVPVLPAGLTGGGVGGDIAREIARIIWADIPHVEGVEGVLRGVRLEQVYYRAAYGQAAARRLAQALSATAGRTGGREAFAKALDAERRYFADHLAFNARRDTVGRLTANMMELYGEELSWNAVIRPTSRPHHKAAHEHNWRPANGAPVQTGGRPGELAHCICYPGPPKPGAPLLV